MPLFPYPLCFPESAMKPFGILRPAWALQILSSPCPSEQALQKHSSPTALPPFPVRQRYGFARRAEDLESRGIPISDPEGFLHSSPGHGRAASCTAMCVQSSATCSSAAATVSAMNSASLSGTSMAPVSRNQQITLKASTAAPSRPDRPARNQNPFVARPQGQADPNRRAACAKSLRTKASAAGSGLL